MRKSTARKRRKHGLAFDKGAVVKYCKVKNAHVGKDVFGMNVYKGAVMKIAAVKLLVGKIYILENKTACRKPYNFFVTGYVVINFLFKFTGIRNVVETIVFFFCKVALLIKGRERKVTAMPYKARVI